MANKKLFYKNIFLIFVEFALVIAPLVSSAKFLNETNQSFQNTATDTEKTSFFSININPDDIFMKIRSFLIITPRKSTTTGLSIDIAVNKGEISKTESWFQATKDYIINYLMIVNGNILQKTGVNVLAVLMFFYNNLYNMFATLFNLIKSVLP